MGDTTIESFIRILLLPHHPHITERESVNAKTGHSLSAIGCYRKKI
jgi:hypothetical protein